MAEEVDGELYPDFEPASTDSCSREEFYAIDEGSGEVSLKRASNLRSLMDGYMQGPVSEGLDITKRAGRAWWQANGDLERRHTMGIYVKELKTKAPVLHVYIDTSSLLQDFTTNKELYLARLANRGFEVSDIKFHLSRKKRTSAPRPAAQMKDPAPEPLAALDPACAQEIDDACKELPESLRATVSKALKLMVARNASEDTRKPKDSLK